ncbi:unnamed protein product [Ambrosiozyma monospora]|uniref:Unnamed protein product n=1 Tax=Ambrosiozyma monospora TaxID=43982 RepID=A0A9W6YXF7_AMBMO|nr:unnamed protein product [Ambrosiozyma monospora]
MIINRLVSIIIQLPTDENSDTGCKYSSSSNAGDSCSRSSAVDNSTNQPDSPQDVIIDPSVSQAPSKSLIPSLTKIRTPEPSISLPPSTTSITEKAYVTSTAGSNVNAVSSVNNDITTITVNTTSETETQHATVISSNTVDTAKVVTIPNEFRENSIDTTNMSREIDSNAANAANTINATSTDGAASTVVNSNLNANATTTTVNTGSTNTVTNTFNNISFNGSNVANNAIASHFNDQFQTTATCLAVTLDAVAKAKSKILQRNKDSTTDHNSDGYSCINNVNNINSISVIGDNTNNNNNDDNNNNNHDSDDSGSTGSSVHAVPNVSNVNSEEPNFINGYDNVNNSASDDCVLGVDSDQVPNDTRMDIDDEPDQTIDDGPQPDDIHTDSDVDALTDYDETDNGEPSSATVAVHNYILDQESSSIPTHVTVPVTASAPNTTTTQSNTDTNKVVLASDPEQTSLPESYFKNPQRINPALTMRLMEVTNKLLIDADNLDATFKDDIDQFLFYARNLYDSLHRKS